MASRELVSAILRESRVIAVVGMSADPAKAAHAVPAFLQSAGYRVIPVNPNVSEVLGEPAYPRLSDVPEPIDVVEVFRPAAEAAAIAEEAVAAGARTLWLQLGLVSADAERIAEEAGLRYVENRCMGVERARLEVVASHHEDRP